MNEVKERLKWFIKKVSEVVLYLLGSLNIHKAHGET